VPWLAFGAPVVQAPLRVVASGLVRRDGTDAQWAHVDSVLAAFRHELERRRQQERCRGLMRSARLLLTYVRLVEGGRLRRRRLLCVEDWEARARRTRLLAEREGVAMPRLWRL